MVMIMLDIDVVRQDFFLDFVCVVFDINIINKPYENKKYLSEIYENSFKIKYL